MGEEELLKRIRAGAISAKDVRAYLIIALSGAMPKKDLKTQKERERLIELLKNMHDERLLDDAKLLLEEYLAATAGDKDGRVKIAKAVKQSMFRIMMEHAGKYANKRTPAVAYVPGVGSERLEQKLGKCRTEACARETLYEMLDLIAESSKASFETLKEELVKEIRRVLSAVYIGAPEKEDVLGGIEAVVEKKIEHYSKAEGEAGEDIPGNLDRSSLMQLAIRHPVLLMLSFYYPELGAAFLKYPKLLEDRKITKYLDEIANAFAKMPALPEAVAEELLKPVKFGDFLCYKLSPC